MTKYFTKEGDEFKEVEGDLLTQEAVNKVIGERVQRVKEQFADYDDLKTKAGSVDTVKSEYEEKLTQVSGEKTDLEKQLGSAKLATEKVKIVHQFKLNDELADFVTGETVEEMQKNAEKLAKGLPVPKVVINKDDKPDTSKNTDSKTLAGKLLGKSDD